MKFTKLSIENFLVLKSATIALADRGLMLVQGENEQDTSANSNGAGKSSIADALCWCLYGVTARGETGDAVINDTAGKGTRVEVVLNDDTTTYRIVRHRKHKTGKNALHVFHDTGMGEKDLTKGTDKLTQEVVDRIIGASLDVFTGSIYAGQEKMPDLPSMTDKMLKTLIEEASGVTVLEEAYRLALQKANEAKANHAQTTSLLTAQDQKVQSERAHLVALKGSDADWATKRDQSIQLINDHVRNTMLPAIKLAASGASQQQVDDLTAQIQAIDVKIAQVGQEQAKFTALNNSRAMAAGVAQAAQRNEQNLRAAAQQANKRASDVSHQIGCPCDSCGRPLTHTELAAAQAAADARAKSAQDDSTKATIEAEEAENALSAAVTAVTSFQQSMTDVSAEVAQRASYEAQRVSAQQKLNTVAQLKNDARAELAKIEALKQETSPFAVSIATAETNILALEDQRRVLDGACVATADELALAQEVAKVFAPAGVRARVLDEVTPYLNAQTGKYLSVLSDGNITATWSTLSLTKAGELRERFAIDVTSGISAKSFKGLSGGEKRKVRVAAALALQDLVATRASKPIDLFIGDEIDDALDASGLERLMTILEDKARERGTVMVISHNSLKDEISQVLTVKRTKSGDTIISETMA